MKRLSLLFLAVLMLLLSSCTGAMDGSLLPVLPDAGTETTEAPAKDAEPTAAPAVTEAPKAEETAAPAETAAPEVTAAPEATEEPQAPLPVDFEWDQQYAGDRETLKLTAKGEDDTVLWTYESDAEAAQLSRFTDIGVMDGRYYLVAHGSVVALDLRDGSTVWENDEFGGSSSYFAWDDKDRLYLCGYYGPHLFVVTKEGKTVKRIATLVEDYSWAYGIAWNDGVITLHFELDMKHPENDDAVFYIDDQTFELLDGPGLAEGWKSAYLQEVKKNHVPGMEDTAYRLQDIDGDGVPELFVETFATASGSQLYTYSKGRGLQILWMDSYGFQYQDGRNLVCNRGGRMDSYYDEVYTIKDGGFELVASGTYGAEDNTKIEYDPEGDPIYDYYWENRKVADKAAYEAELDKVFPKKTAHAPLEEAKWDDAKGRYVDNGFRSYDEILADLG